MIDDQMYHGEIYIDVKKSDKETFRIRTLDYIFLLKLKKKEFNAI